MGERRLPEETMAPEGLLHYQPGRVVTREINYDGERWLVTWIAEWDGVGWRVHSSSIAPRGPACCDPR